MSFKGRPSVSTATDPEITLALLGTNSTKAGQTTMLTPLFLHQSAEGLDTYSQHALIHSL